MNHLKHIRGINVLPCTTSNAVLPSRYGQRIDNQSRSQLSNSLLVKKNYGIGIKHPEQYCQDGLRYVSRGSRRIFKQHSNKTSVTSLKKKSSINKKLSLEPIMGTLCHYSTYKNAKFYNSGINKRHIVESMARVNGAKNINRNISFVASVEKQSRSYAEMISDYSEAIYNESTIGTRNDSPYFNNTIRKSPFSTLSTPSLAKKIENITEHSEVLIEREENNLPLSNAVKSFNRCIRHNNINTVKCHNSQHHDTRIIETVNKNANQDCIIINNLKDNDQSYARLIDDCSKSIRNIALASISNGALILKKNMLVKNFQQSFTTSTRKVSSTNIQETLQNTTSTIPTLVLEKNMKRQVIDSKEDYWSREIENVMIDLKNITERKTAKFVNIKSKDTIQPMDASGNMLDRIHKLTEFMQPHKQKEKDVAVRKLGYQSDKIDKMEKRERDLNLKKHNWQLTDKTSDSAQYLDKTIKNSSARKNLTQVPTSGSTSILKQPQVKLRMVPSEKESVVSINVDSPSTGLLDPLNPASKQLSVIVQSDQKQDLRSTENEWNAPMFRQSIKNASQRSDFGQMRISISENSAPVKQIEFSINGKPVSELKSITAKTEKLDVVSSMDKIEIRIPFAKDNANTLNKIKESDLSTEIGSSIGQILNLQISANFQNEPAKDNAEQSSGTINKIPTSSSQTSKSNSSRTNIKPDNIIENNINDYQIFSNTDFKIQSKPMKNLSDDKDTTNVLLTKEANNPEVERSNTKKSISIIRSPETNKYDKNESDSRVPSKIVPWWSSTNSFNKIKKKKDYKPFEPSSNNNEKKTSNFNQNFVTSKSKQVPNSKTLTEKIQSMNNATITTNDSTNLISHSNSVEERMESNKSTLKLNQLHYPNSSRLKTNRENFGTNSEVMKNVSKTEDNQLSTTKEGNKKVSEIKQTKPVTSSISGIMNIQDEHDVSTEGNTSILPRKFKAPRSAQYLSLKQNREKKHTKEEDNYSPKQTKSIDDISSAKSKMENILNIMKLIEKKKDGIIIDYGLTMSPKEPTVKLNNEVKYLQNPFPINMKKNNSVSNKSTAVKVPKREQNSKIILAEQAKSSEAKKLEINTNILKEKEDLTVKNATTYIKTQNKNDAKNIKQVHKNNAMTSKYSNLKNSSKLTQILKKQESLAANTTVLQDNSKQNLNEMQTKSNINPNKIINTNKLSFSQTKPRSTSKIKYRAALKHLIVKNTEEMPIADQPADKLDIKVNEKDATAKIVTPNSKSQTSLPKNSEKNCISRKLKSGKDRGNSSGSTDFLRKSTDSACFMSSDSKAHIKSRVISNDNRTYAGKLLFMDSYSNIDRKDDVLSNSTEPWTDMDRPEKSMLYSAWLQQFRNNISKNKKLF